MSRAERGLLLSVGLTSKARRSDDCPNPDIRTTYLEAWNSRIIVTHFVIREQVHSEAIKHVLDYL
jgi:hypothetical protein